VTDASDATSGTSVPLVRMRGITRRFGDVVANDTLDLDLHAGEIHALLGENGAGKSTLMHVLSGLLRPDAGSIELDDRPLRLSGPLDAIKAGIGMVHQHFKLVPTMSVAANIVLNDEPSRRGLLDSERMRRDVRELCARFGLTVDPDARVEDTSIATQQKVEILKVLHREVRVLILDEPTAVLTPHEVRDLFAFLRDLAASGTAIVLITHKLSEVLDIADRVTILRQGRLVATQTPEGLTRADLARLMVGREVLLSVRRTQAARGEAVLEMQDVHAHDDRGLPALRGIDLECHAGEIVGIAGVDGNGQRELVEVIAGLRPASSGILRLLGADAPSTAAERIRRGIAYVPEDRHRRGLVLDMTLEENLVLRTYRDPPFARRLRLRRSTIAQHARRLLDAYRVTARPAARARALSGGNQQKVVLARELEGSPRLVVAAQPTRGVDVGATQFVYDQLLAQREAGAGVLLVSLDLEELLALSDRIAVIYEGRIVARLDASAATQEALGAYMTGAREAERVA
jgi:general nucleoside transport system ATP-binding protein